MSAAETAAAAAGATAPSQTNGGSGAANAPRASVPVASAVAVSTLSASVVGSASPNPATPPALAVGDASHATASRPFSAVAAPSPSHFPTLPMLQPLPLGTAGSGSAAFQQTSINGHHSWFDSHWLVAEFQRSTGLSGEGHALHDAAMRLGSLQHQAPIINCNLTDTGHGTAGPSPFHFSLPGRSTLTTAASQSDLAAAIATASYHDLRADGICASSAVPNPFPALSMAMGTGPHSMHVDPARLGSNSAEAFINHHSSFPWPQPISPALSNADRSSFQPATTTQTAILQRQNQHQPPHHHHHQQQQQHQQIHQHPIAIPASSDNGTLTHTGSEDLLASATSSDTPSSNDDDRSNSMPLPMPVAVSKPGRTKQQEDKYSLRKHMCPECKQVYARASTLKTHMRTHSGERPYTCNQCQKSFSQQANLNAHMRTHTGEKPFSCPQCGKEFSQSSSVTTHMRTHTGDKPYQCPQCDKAFADTSTLTKHIRVHTYSKPYTCNLCGKGFSQSGNLNRHMRTHSRQ